MSNNQHTVIRKMDEQQLQAEFEKLWRRVTETSPETGDVELYGETIQELNRRGWWPKFKTVIQWERITTQSTVTDTQPAHTPRELQ